MKTAVPGHLVAGRALGGISTIRCVIAVINNAIKGSPARSVVKLTDISLRRPWFSAIFVKSKFFQFISVRPLSLRDIDREFSSIVYSYWKLDLFQAPR